MGPVFITGLFFDIIKFMLKLAFPNVKYKTLFYSLIDELKRKKIIKPSVVNIIKSKDFKKYITELRDLSKNKNIQKGRVPQTEYWLIENNVLVGNLIVRHKLNKKFMDGHIGFSIRPSKQQRGDGGEILRLGLLKAKKLGLKKVMITCDETNIGSKKVIEANGGKFKNKYKNKKMKVARLIYWINIKQ